MSEHEKMTAKEFDRRALLRGAAALAGGTSLLASGCGTGSESVAAA